MFSEKIQKTKGQSTDESILKHIPNLLHNLRLRRKKIANLTIKGYLNKQLKEGTQKANRHLGRQLTSSIIRETMIHSLSLLKLK